MEYNYTLKGEKMSWSKYLKLSITNEEIESILDSIKALGFFGKWIHTSWGYSSECDIKNEGNKIIFSGAEFSRNTDLPARFKKEARKRGLYIKRKKNE